MQNVLPTSHVFDTAAIEAAQAKDIPALLDRLAGISLLDAGGRGTSTAMYIRGIYSSKILILVDGVRVGDINENRGYNSIGATILNNYPIELIERIEVIKGPHSSLYGADAAGGVIQLFTKKGLKSNNTVSLSAGSNGLVEAGVSLNGGNKRNNFTLNLVGENGDGIDSSTHSTNGADEKNGFKESALSLAGQLTLSETTTAQLSSIYSDNSLELESPFGGANIELRDDKRNINTALKFESQLNDILRWTNTLGTNKTQLIFASKQLNVTDVTTKRSNLRSELDIRLNEDSNLTIGADYYQEKIQIIATYGYSNSSELPKTSRDNTGLFAQYLTSKGKLGLSSSFRYDDNSAYGSNTSGNAALSYKLNNSTRAVVSYGTAFNAPTFNQHDANSGNTDISAEKSKSLEVSLLGSTKNIDWRLSTYQGNNDEIVFFDITSIPQTSNLGDSERKYKGIEAELTKNIAKWDVSLNIDYVSAKVKFGDRESNLIGPAGKTINISAARNFGALDLRFDMKNEGGRYYFNYLNPTQELDTHKSYTLFDISGSYALNRKATLAVNIDNIFDKDYTIRNHSTFLSGEAPERYNTEGRQAKLTLKYDF